MKFKLGFYVLLVVFLVEFSCAKNEQKRRRPIIDSVAQDSDGNYIDQIASDTISYQSSNVVTAPENNPKRYHSASDEFRKTSYKNVASTEQKVHYVTPEPHNNNFSHDYVHHALKTNEKSKEKSPAKSFLEYSSETREEPKKVSTPKRKKSQPASSEDYNYYFPESKRINSRTTEKPKTTTKDASEKYYKPQSPGAIITKDQKINDDGSIETYHYYYPEENSYESKTIHNDFGPFSSTFAPTTTTTTTKPPKTKFSSKKRAPLEHASTDSYQYQPVLQRPNEYVSTDDSTHGVYPGFSTYDSKHYLSHSTPTPSSTPSSIKMLKPTKKSNYYLPSSTISPSSTARPIKIRRPSVETRDETSYDDVKQFSLSPSSPSQSSLPHFSPPRAPEVYKYSTQSPVSSTVHGDFYINPSTQVTPSASPVDLFSNEPDQRTVVIKPKVQYQNHENFELAEQKFESYESETINEKQTYQNSQQNQDSYESIKDKDLYHHHEIYEPVKERIMYKFVPEETQSYEANKTADNVAFFSTRSPFIEAMQSPDNRQVLNKSKLDIDYYKDLQKNYNYEFFTEQDAGPMRENDATMKMDHMYESESESIDEKQKATKKNMMFHMNPQHNEYDQYQQYQNEYQQQQMVPMNLEDHEMPPPVVSETDNEAEASKNQYFVLYSVDEEEKRQKKRKPKSKPEPDVVYHHHTHDHDKGEEYQHFDSEFDSEVTNSDNVRIVDPSVRGGRPIEFTKDDYLRHIKQAVVQYMKDYQPKDQGTSGVKLKNQRFQEGSQEIPYRPTKSPSVATTPSTYKHSLPSNQYKTLAPMKLPKNHYTAGRLKDAIEDLQESPQVDLTVKKHKQKPFDLSAIDVGQSYQHVSHFDHSAALKNVEEFDQTNVVNHNLNKPKLHFSQQTYHDINNLGFNQKPKSQNDDSENDSNQSANLFKGYVLPNKYSLKGNQGGSSGFTAMNYDASKLPRIVSQHGHQQNQHQQNSHDSQHDEDEEDNKVEDPIDAPIQIINGIPVANPYNIDLNTLKYMLGGIAQAEVNDQLKDLDESPSNNHKFPANWKSFSPNQLGSYTSNAPVYQVYGANENSQRHKKNTGQTINHGINSNQQSKFPLVGSMVNNFNKAKNQNSNNNSNNRKKNSNKGNNNNEPTYHLSDFSGWNQMNKKTRTEPQGAPSNSHYILRPVSKSKNTRDENLYNKGSINRVRQPMPPTDMRPPPPIKPKAHLRLLKVH